MAQDKKAFIDTENSLFQFADAFNYQAVKEILNNIDYEEVVKFLESCDDYRLMNQFFGLVYNSQNYFTFPQLKNSENYTIEVLDCLVSLLTQEDLEKLSKRDIRYEEVYGSPSGLKEFISKVKIKQLEKLKLNYTKEISNFMRVCKNPFEAKFTENEIEPTHDIIRNIILNFESKNLTNKEKHAVIDTMHEINKESIKSDNNNSGKINYRSKFLNKLNEKMTTSSYC